MLLLTLLALAFLPLSSPASFNPSTSYFLACGSSAAVSVTDRTFQPDAPYLLGSPPSSSSSSSSNTSPAPYSTSRSFSSDATYRFTISNPGTYILRLHFSSSSSRFSVSIPSRFLLLDNFTPPSSPTTKEYLLHAAPGALDLLFTPSPLASISAIELFSAPPALLSAAPPSPISDFSLHALEPIHRINAGGPAANDTLYRLWLPDAAFLSSNATSFANSTDQNLITFQEQKGRSELIAPRIVYSTARTMAINPYLVPQSYNFNVSWSFPVPPGYLYFVRLHFCDFLFNPGELYFDVYIGDDLATKDLHPVDETDGRPSSAFYKDYAASPTGPGFINVTIGRASSKDVPASSINAILNGLEIMKVNNNLSSSSSSSLDKKRKISSSHLVVIIAAAVAVCVVVIAAGLGVCLFFLCNRRGQTNPSSSSSKRKQGSTPASSWSPFRPNRPTPFTSIEGTTTTPGASPIPNAGSLNIPLAEIKLATNGFDESFLIGNGGFGKVYKGVLTDGTEVAVKRASPGSRQGFPEFQTEIVVLSDIRHRHLVSLIGYCCEEPEMILVYEYMEGGPLKNYLYGDSGGENKNLPCLSWKQRLEICIGAARGLHYLHSGYSYNVIHRDVKSSNILLAGDYSAKVSDFGLSRLGPSMGETHVSTAVKGTFGYLDPEYFKVQKLTDKSDVYSFGVVLFEVVCARPAIDQTVGREQSNLAEWGVWCQEKGVLEKIVDARIGGAINGNSLRMVGKTAARCVAEYGVDRPTMGEVLWNLEYALQLQQTEVRREPHEDSVKVEVGIEVAEVRRAAPPVAVAGGGKSGGLEMSTSDVFSQLITDEGR